MKQTINVIVLYRAMPVDVIINGHSVTVMRPTLPQQEGSNR